jgi:hypothetical protein
VAFGLIWKFLERDSVIDIHYNVVLIYYSCAHSLTHTHTPSHSLQQFVKGAGSFVTEMADAVLNGLTNNRHSKFMAKFREFEERERKPRETPANTSSSGTTASLSRDGSRDDETEKSPTSAKEEEGSTTTPVEGKDGASNVEGEGTEKLLINAMCALFGEQKVGNVMLLSIFITLYDDKMLV